MALSMSCVNIKLDFISFIKTLYRFGFFFAERWSNTSNKLLQLATQHCCIASWKALLAELPPTSNIVTQQNLLLQVEEKCCLYYRALRGEKYCQVRDSNPLSLGVFLEPLLTVHGSSTQRHYQGRRNDKRARGANSRQRAILLIFFFSPTVRLP